MLVLPEYLIHLLYNVLFLFSGEFFTLLINLPLIAYHINRCVEQIAVTGKPRGRRTRPEMRFYWKR
ncbi:hypothetical protein IscW_ISCW007754 [Ixodes scapularis]|uniref:Uncharacterized protein n=1 Tax=Ixodes scapularis TaxID=6945 RepID=B7PS53_IXOSC|nr:hypothetical protein IscW_ISCW007754 [Ixodes scapularis]|eukprot:XP_002401993.1 hypothetical protein IscW_ISCW007754 [Ixodes scapularis]